MGKWPHFEEDEIASAVAVLNSGKVNYWTGQEGASFEKEFADYFGVSHAIAVSNGTVALELCCYALGLGAGDEVIVPSRTFIATASAVELSGASPVFCDIDLDSQNMTVETIDAVRTAKTKAIICVHLGGWPCDMPAIMAYAKKHKLYVIEDCAQAHGAMINNHFLGSFGHMNAFSFCQDKIMTTGGEGGMVVTNDENLYKKAWSYKDHGKSYDKVFAEDQPPGFKWLHDAFGTNFRMTEMQSAIGRIQLRKLKGWLEARAKNARMLANAFKQYPFLRIPQVPEGFVHANYKFYMFVDPKQMSVNQRDALIQEITAQNVRCFTGSCSEVYLEKAFENHPGVPKKRFKHAKQISETSLMFEVHPTLTSDDMQRLIEACCKVFDSIQSQ